MSDNIKPEHYRTGEIEHAKKNTKTLKELFADMGIDFDEFMRKHTKEYTLKKLWSVGYRYLARNKDGHLYAYDDSPVKFEDAGYWDVYNDLDSGLVFRRHYFQEVQWSDDEPTKIADLLAKFENGGENGKEEAE